MALIDKDTIRKEIERRIKIYGNPRAGEATQYDVRKKHALVGLLDYLDSLPEQPTGEISDGYHTFNELYYYRMLYNAAFFNLLPKEWVHKSKRHHDGEECFGGGWFIVMAELPTGQISNHYELKDWDLFKIPEKEFADEWDGHTPKEAADRLHKYLFQQERPEDIVAVAKTFLDALSKTPYNNKPITDTQIIVKQLLLFFENPKEYNPSAILEQPVEGIKEELKRYLNSDEYINTRENGTLLIARHFAEWGAEQKAIEPFRKQNCKNCGSQRCAGEGEWLEGCEKFREWKDKTYKN